MPLVTRSRFRSLAVSRPADLRHREIHQNDVRPRLGGPGEALEPVSGGRHSKAVHAQEFRKGAPLFLDIVDDQDQRRQPARGVAVVAHPVMLPESHAEEELVVSINRVDFAILRQPCTFLQYLANVPNFWASFVPSVWRLLDKREPVEHFQPFRPPRKPPPRSSVPRPVIVDQH